MISRLSSCGSSSRPAPRKLSELDAFLSLEIKKGKAKEVLVALLDDNVNVREADTGDSALHLCIAYHQRKISDRLLQCKSLDVNAANLKGQTPLHYAIFHRNQSAINQLLKKGDELNPSLCDSNGNNILHYAAMKSLSSKETRKILIRLQKSHGDLSSLVNRQNSTGNTPLHEAVEHGSLDLEKLFISYNQDLLGWRNSAGETPLDISLRLKKDTQTAMLLSLTPSDLYPDDLLSRIVESNMDQLLEQLFIAVSSGRSKTKGVVSVLGYQFTLQSIEGVESRIKGKYNQSIMESKGSYVHWSIVEKKSEILKVLLSHPDIDLTLQDDEGNTPLHLALDARYYSYEIVRHLLDWLFLKKRLSEGPTRQTSKQLKLMMENEHLPVWSVYLKTIINKQNRQGQTPLLIAISSGMGETMLVHCINQLINLGADVTLSDRKGNTPLFSAVYLRNITAVEALRISGASSEVTNCDGVSPLDLAMKSEDEEMINALTADIEVLPRESKTKRKVKQH